MSIYANGFTKDNLKVLRKQLDAVLATAIPGVKLTASNISFLNGSATIKVEAQVEGAQTREQVFAKEMAELYGLDLDKKVMLKGAGMCQLTEYRHKARTKPWIVQNEQGTQYILTQAQAEQHFKKA